MGTGNANLVEIVRIAISSSCKRGWLEIWSDFLAFASF